MDRSRRSVKLPITSTHSRSHHRAVNKIISTMLGIWIITIGRPGAAAPVPEYVARRPLTTAIRKRLRHELIARSPLWFSTRKNALRTNRWLVSWHFTTAFRNGTPVDGEFDVGTFQFHATRFPMGQDTRQTRFLLRSKSVESRRYRLINIIIVTLSSELRRSESPTAACINAVVDSSQLCRVYTTSRVRSGTRAARILYLIIEECFVRVGSRTSAVRS